jgi:SAM-dependent methyltransferase
MTDAAAQNSGNDFIAKLRRYYQATRGASRRQILPRLKWAHHYDGRTFDWDWQSVHVNRIAVVNKLLSKKPDPAYLEIGCASNALFNSVLARNKVGVDPAEGGTVRKTSDAFFADNRETFDVVFIDGLHHYDQVRRDVINAIKFLNPDGWVALHDMLPRTWLEHHVPRINGMWTGDVWKVAFELAETEGIDFKILKIDCGVGVFRLTRDNVTLKDLTATLGEQEFSYFCDNITKLPIVEWDDARDWLES